MATGTPRAGHGGSFAQACKIRMAKKCRATQCGHSIISRRGASNIWPSFVYIYLKPQLKIIIKLNFQLTKQKNEIMIKDTD